MYYSHTFPSTFLPCHRWSDLPPEIVNTIFALVLYKRDVGRLVCRAWDAAIRDAVTRLRLPASHLAAVQRYPAVTWLHLMASMEADSTAAVAAAADQTVAAVTVTSGKGEEVGVVDGMISEMPAAAVAATTTGEAVAATAAMLTHLGTGPTEPPPPPPTAAAAAADLAQVWQQLSILPTLNHLVLICCPDTAFPPPAAASCMTRLTKLQLKFLVSTPSTPNFQTWPLQRLPRRRWNPARREKDPLSVLKTLGDSLQELVIEDCQLKRLPEWFGQTLTGLTSLVLRGNELSGGALRYVPDQQLPGSFSMLQQLQVRRRGNNGSLFKVSEVHMLIDMAG